MEVHEAIRAAEALLPGEPVDDGEDPRWQAIIAVGEHVEADPDPVWEFILRWGGHAQADLRDAVACCLLEHILEYHFDAYFLRVEASALADAMFADTFGRCSRFGQAQEPANAARADLLAARLS